MVDEPRLDPELAEVERELSRFAPRPGKLDHARLMYLAGQASVRPGSAATRFGAHWIWPGAAAVTSLAALTFGVLLLIPAEPQVVEKIVYVERAVETGPPPTDHRVQTFTRIETPRLSPTLKISQGAATPHYLIARQRALAYGLDAMVEDAPSWTSETGESRPPSSIRALRMELLDSLAPSHRLQEDAFKRPTPRNLGDTT